MFTEGELHPNPELLGQVKAVEEMLEEQFYSLRTEGFIKVPTNFEFGVEEYQIE